MLTDLGRKTAEPLAKYAGTPARCLQQFLKACLWDHDGLTDGVQQTLRDAVAELPPDPVGTVGILDETSAGQAGTKTPGVQRQYLGCAGKVANGIVTVHLVAAHGPFKALLDSELFLPESWDADRERAAGKPTSPTRSAIGRSGRSDWSCWLEPSVTAGGSTG